MKLIIDIPEAAYKLLNSDEQIDWLDAETILEVVARGTPYEYEERSKGKWVRDKDGYWVCSVCGAIGEPPHVHEPTSNYCHWCGADMRKDKI